MIISRKSVLFILIMTIMLFIPNQVLGEKIEKECIGDEFKREMKLDISTSIQKFDEANKKFLMIVDVDIEDNKPEDPFKAYVFMPPGSGADVVHVNQDEVDKNYHVNQKFTEPRFPAELNFFPSLWPFERYHNYVFLVIDDEVQFCDYEMFSTYIGGHFAENPDWDIQIEGSISSVEEFTEIIEGANPRFEKYTIIKLDTELFRSHDYFWKHVFYVIAPLFPIPLIIAHWRFIKHERTVTHVTFFTGVSILILTGVFIIRNITPIDLTMVEAVLLTGIAAYASGFFGYLWKSSSKRNIVSRLRE